MTYSRASSGAATPLFAQIGDKMNRKGTVEISMKILGFCAAADVEIYKEKIMNTNLKLHTETYKNGFVPIMVGRMYKLYPSPSGIQSLSTRTNSLMHSSNSCWLKS
jgi:hypothetical protein